ncbi:MAG: hypothetical protein IIY21_03820 [Clostridiales bacterium]|nr:hypothetical protein [Clostridiales bacterium]
MTNEEAKTFLDNLKVCIEEHPIVADWLVEIADRKTENSSEKPNNCEDLQDWKDRMWAEAIVTEPTISKMEQVDKDINVRSKTEPEIDGAIDEARFKAHCMNCQRDVADIKCLDCDGDKYFIKDEPQTDKEIILDPSFAELSDEQFVEAMKLIEPQTDCSWK